MIVEIGEVVVTVEEDGVEMEEEHQADALNVTDVNQKIILLGIVLWKRRIM